MRNSILLAILLFTNTHAFAEGEIGSTIIEPKSSIFDNMTVQGGLGLSTFNYKEDVPLPLKSTETGTLTTYTFGVTKIFSPQDDNPNIYKLTLSFSPSSTTYDGTTQLGDPVPQSTRLGSKFFEAESSIVLPTSSLLNLYVGLGYHSWVRGASNDPGIYPEFYRWAYIPLGGIYKVAISRKLKMDIDGSLRPTLMGKMTAELAKVKLPDHTFDLGRTIGIKLQVPVSLEVGEKSSLIFTPWYERSSIGESNFVAITEPDANGQVYGAIEPASTTYQLGFNISYAVTL